MTSAGSRIVKVLLAGLLASLAGSPRDSLAMGFGFPHGFHHGYVTTSRVTTSGIGTSSVLMPMSLATMPVAHTMTGVGTVNGALLPASVMPSSLLTSSLMPAAVMPQFYTASVPGFYVSNGASGASASAPALLPNALGAAAVKPAALGGDFRTEYNAFVHGENALSPAGITLHPADVQQFGTTLASLSGAVGGPQRLASIGRFLRNKLSDPNFDAKALDLISWVIEATNPSLAPAIGTFRPVIDTFLNQIRQNSGDLAPAPPALPHKKADANPNPFGNTNEPLRVIVSFENGVPSVAQKPAAPKPGQATSPVDTIEQLAPLFGATILSKDATGITLRTADGREIKLDPNGKPVVPK